MEQDKFYKIYKKEEILYFKVIEQKFSNLSKTLFSYGNCLSILIEQENEDFEMYSNYEISNKDKTIEKIEEITYEEYKEILMTYSVKLL